MVNGSECAPITDFAGYANRTILANNGVVVYDYYGTTASAMMQSLARQAL